MNLKKSVYSLVLTDAVVEAADRMAYAKGTSRSALIDEILARALSCITPEMRMRDIFSALADLIQSDEVFRLQGRASDSMMSLHSAIQYKYKPTIRYSVELYRRAQNGVFGELKIQSRTQSAPLLRELAGFYELWIATEHRLTGRKGQYFIEDGRLVRRLSLPDGAELCTEAELGEAIGFYIRTFDSAMKTYFACLSDKYTAGKQVAHLYTNYMNTQEFLLL